MGPEQFSPLNYVAISLIFFHSLFCWLEYHNTGANLFHTDDLSRPYEPNTGTTQLLLETTGCCFQFQPLLQKPRSSQEASLPFKSSLFHVTEVDVSL